MIVLDFIYYRFYRVSKWIALRDPEESPIFLLPFLLLLNAIYITSYCVGKLPINKNNSIIVFLTYGFIVLIFYLIFMRKKRHLKIIDHFKNESKKKDIIYNIIALIYVAITMNGMLILFLIK